MIDGLIDRQIKERYKIDGWIDWETEDRYRMDRLKILGGWIDQWIG